MLVNLFFSWKFFSSIVIIQFKFEHWTIQINKKHFNIKKLNKFQWFQNWNFLRTCKPLKMSVVFSCSDRQTNDQPDDTGESNRTARYSSFGLHDQWSKACFWPRHVLCSILARIPKPKNVVFRSISIFLHFLYYNWFHMLRSQASSHKHHSMVAKFSLLNYWSRFLCFGWLNFCFHRRLIKSFQLNAFSATHSRIVSLIFVTV